MHYSIGKNLLKMVGALVLLAPAGFAANTVYTWDASGTHPAAPTDGAGTWNTSSANWTTGGADVAFGNNTTSQANLGTNNGAAGAISVSGTVALNKIAFSAAGSGNYTLGGSGTLSFGGAVPTISIAASLTPTINTVLGDSGSGVTFTATSGSSGTITLDGANTFTGTATVSQATVNFNTLAIGGTASSFGAGANTVPVVIGNNGSFASAVYTGSGGSTDRPWTVGGSSASDAIVNNGTGAISFNNTGSAVSGTAGARTLTLKGSYNGAANTFAETLSDMTGFTSALIVSGNTWNLTGANTHSGGTTLGVSGVLNLGNASALGSGTFTVSGNGSLDNTTGGNLSVNNALVLSGGNPTYVGSANSLTINGPVTLSGANRTITVNANTLTLGGQITGAFALTTAGSGTLFLLGVNTYGGGTTISGAGILLLTNDSTLGSSSAGLTFSASGVLAATNNGAVANNPVTIGSARNITVNSGVTASFWTPDTNNLIVAAQITGAGAVLKKSSSHSLGTVRFSNDTSSFTGDFTMGYGNTEFTSVANQGTASSLGEGAAATGGAITLGNSTSAGTFRYVGTANSSTTRPLNWTATGSGITLDNTNSGTVQYLATGNLRSGAGGAVGLTLAGSNTGANTLAQVINDLSGATSVTKTGSGTWILSGANTYSGATTVSAGTLLINGSLASGSVVTATNGGALGGSGTINGTVTVLAGGTLQPSVSGSVNTLTLSSTTSPAFPTGTNYATLKFRVPASSTADHLYLSDTTAAVFNAGNLNLAIDTTGLSGDVTGATIVQVGQTSGGIGGAFHTVTVNNGYTATIHYNAQTITLDLAGTITASGTLSALTTTYGTPSETTSFSVSGTQLTGNLTVALPAGYEASTSSGSGYTNSLSLVPTSGTLAATTVYVRLATSSAVGSYAGNIQIAGGGAAAVNVATVSSTVHPATLTYTANSASMTYGGPVPSLSGSVSGFVDGDTQSSATTGTLSFATTASASSPVGSYAVNGSGLTAANYTFVQASGNATALTIGQAATSVGVSSSENPSGYKDSIFFTAWLPSAATGNVVFASTNGPISTNIVSGGAATSLSITNLSRGTNFITASYSGDGNFLGSTGTLSQMVTNHPPVAGVMTATRTAGLTVRIALSDIATNWSDVDGDTVELTSVTMQSTNGVILVALNWTTNLAGSFVTTNPYAYIGYPNGSNVADQISYAISDGQGGTNLGYVNIVIQTSVAGTNSITGYTFGPASNTVTSYGIPGYSYTLERATNLAPAVWVEVATNCAGTNGVIHASDVFSDLGGAAPASAYYRLQWQP